MAKYRRKRAKKPAKWSVGMPPWYMVLVVFGIFWIATTSDHTGWNPILKFFLDNPIGWLLVCVLLVSKFIFRED